MSSPLSSSHPPSTTTDIDHDLGGKKNKFGVGPQTQSQLPSNGNAETPATMSEQSSIRLADEKQRQQDDDKAAEEGLSGGGDNNATQAALPISQLIFIVVALVLGIFMVCCRSS